MGIIEGTSDFSQPIVAYWEMNDGTRVPATVTHQGTSITVTAKADGRRLVLCFGDIPFYSLYAHELPRLTDDGSVTITMA